MSVLSLNDRALAVADELVQQAGDFGVEPKLVGTTRVVDAGVKTLGTIDAGVMLARACLADLATVKVVPVQIGDVQLPGVAVNARFPVAACMASQYAGWQIKGEKFYGMGSGPMRAAYGKEKLYDDIGFRERPTCAVGVIESAKLPTVEVVQDIALKCNVPPRMITLLVAPTASLAGGVQVVARSVETALHKLHELGFDLKRVVAGYGTAPLPPVAADDLAAIGRTNDAVLYGGRVTLVVTGDDESITDVGQRLPSSASTDYGEPFANIFERHGGDFYKIDPMLFSPATVVMQNMATGRTQVFGKVDDEVLRASFFS